MSQVIGYLCDTDGECPRHGKYIYFCYECHEEWREKNPLTHRAIVNFANGKGSRASIDAARKKDKENGSREA